jgi:hypothetical protein
MHRVFDACICACCGGVGAGRLFFYIYFEVYMQAVQFKTAVSNGTISIPKEYYSKLSPVVEVIILSKTIPETMIMSEKSLAKDWDTPDEDEAWRTL